MGEYMPSTSVVRTRYTENGHGDRSSRHSRLGEFDRWLASVKAEAWDEGVSAQNEAYDYYPENPYREG